MHPPKVHVFDLPACINIDNKRFRRAVAVYRTTPFGLYMSREMVGRESAHWIQTWVLPKLGLCVTDWWWNPGHQRDQDFYLDVADIERAGDVWTVTDHYLDIVVRTGRDTQVLDVDEYVAAVSAGLLDAGAARRALDTACRTVVGIAEHGHDVDAWLAGFGIRLTWRQR